MFSTQYDTYFLLSMHFKMSSAISFNLDQSKIFSSANGLTVRKKAYKPSNIPYENIPEKLKMPVNIILSFFPYFFFFSIILQIQHFLQLLQCFQLSQRNCIIRVLYICCQIGLLVTEQNLFLNW